jgi:putative ABC transport system permease protein
MKEVRAALAGIDPAVPPFDIRSMADVVGASIVDYTVVGRLVLIAAAIALLLAMAGMTGVLMRAVSRREREIGVRLALGADAWRVRRLILGQVLLVCGIGTAAGVTMAGGVGQLLSHLLYGVAATDPLVWLTAVVGVNSAALLASMIPLRRATGVDPVISLRSE